MRVTSKPPSDAVRVKIRQILVIVARERLENIVGEADRLRSPLAQAEKIVEGELRDLSMSGGAGGAVGHDRNREALARHHCQARGESVRRAAVLDDRDVIDPAQGPPHSPGPTGVSVDLLGLHQSRRLLGEHPLSIQHAEIDVEERESQQVLHVCADPAGRIDRRGIGHGDATWS